MSRFSAASYHILSRVRAWYAVSMGKLFFFLQKSLPSAAREGSFAIFTYPTTPKTVMTAATMSSMTNTAAR